MFCDRDSRKGGRFGGGLNFSFPISIRRRNSDAARCNTWPRGAPRGGETFRGGDGETTAGSASVVASQTRDHADGGFSSSPATRTRKQ